MYIKIFLGNFCEKHCYSIEHLNVLNKFIGFSSIIYINFLNNFFLICYYLTPPFSQCTPYSSLSARQFCHQKSLNVWPICPLSGTWAPAFCVNYFKSVLKFSTSCGSGGVRLSILGIFPYVPIPECNWRPCALNSLFARFIIVFIFIILSSAPPSFAFFHLAVLLSLHDCDKLNLELQTITKEGQE